MYGLHEVFSNIQYVLACMVQTLIFLRIQSISSFFVRNFRC